MLQSLIKIHQHFFSSSFPCISYVPLFPSRHNNNKKMKYMCTEMSMDGDGRDGMENGEEL